MVVLGAVLIFVALGVWLFCLFEVLATDGRDIRRLPKFAWFVIVLLGSGVGAVAWLVSGRPRRPLAAGDVPAWPPAFLTVLDETDDADETGDGPARPLGPDDDPEFLRALDRRLRGED